MTNVVKRTGNDFYSGESAYTAPVYSFDEVAEFLQLPRGTVRNWAFGYRRTRASTGFRPVILAADVATRRLSFENLVELHVLSALVRDHDVSLANVRTAIAELRKAQRSDHPFADTDVLTDGIDVFVERYGRLINASAAGQIAITAVLQKYLRRIKRSADGRAVRVFPITRQGADPDDIPKLVAIDPRVRFGQPFLVGCGVETAVIAARIKGGESAASVARDFDVSEEAIEEAIRFELPAAA